MLVRLLHSAATRPPPRLSPTTAMAADPALRQHLPELDDLAAKAGHLSPLPRHLHPDFRQASAWNPGPPTTHSQYVVVELGMDRRVLRTTPTCQWQWRPDR